MYAVEVLDGRFCYVHKNRHVERLSTICVERASALLRLASATVSGGLHRVPAPELQQLLDELASRSPLRSLAWRDVAPLCQLGRLSQLRLERLLVTHADLRAVLASVDPQILTHLSIWKASIRCKCQDLGPGPGWDERLRGGCHEQRKQDVLALVDVVGRTKRLQLLDTDLEVDVERLVALGPFQSLSRLTLTRLAVSGRPRNSLTGRELQLLLLQMPVLRELRCNVTHALSEVGVGVQPLLGRLEALNALLENPTLLQPAGSLPIESLVWFCPNIREAS
ncbi:unnamed protein product [Ixodes hexagonus]